MTEYRAGACNIGREHQRRRLYGGVAALAIAVVYAAWVLLTDQPVVYLAGTFVLLVGGILGYLQARSEFCVAFGLLARYDLRGSDGDAGSVAEADDRRRDRLYALQLLAYAVGLAATLTLLVYAVDVFVLG